MLLLMSLVAPGSAQLSAGNRQVGRFALRAALSLLASLLLLVCLWFVWRDAALRLLTWAPLLLMVRWLLVFLAVGWVALFVDAWRLGRPLMLARDHRLKLFGLTGALSLVTLVALIVSSNYVGSAHDLVAGVFGNGTGEGKKDGRYNVLLLGGDAGEDRVGLRPDSITVASIDAETGESILFGLPRNLENVPFPKGSVMRVEWPDGFDCGDECLLNAVYTWAEDHVDLFPGVERPGIEATRDAVEAVTGLQVSYTVMIDLQGFQQLVDAVGGVTLDVGKRVPLGINGGRTEGWIETGTQKMDGGTALWFARSRKDATDYERMTRQKCVMSAMLKQLNPTTVLTSFQGLASASANTIWTDVPAARLPGLMSLALKAKAQTPQTVSFVPPAVETADPDFRLIRTMVKDALVQPNGEAVPTVAPAPAGGSEGAEAPTAADGANASPDSPEVPICGAP